MKNRLTICLVILALAFAGTASAQMGSELKGRVIFDNAPMPGVTVSLTSPALQGQKVAVTNAQGDYIFKALPAGDYHVRFELASFATLEYDVRMSTSQPRALDAVMYPEAMQEEIVVTSSFENVSTGAQGSSTMEQSTLEKLPVARTLNQAVLLSAGTSASGPGGNISISGSQSWESLYTINGVVVNENIRGQALDLYIEDAVLETTTMTSNMSAEYGRFAGGVVNTVTKSGGNQFSGSFRANPPRWTRTAISTRPHSVVTSCATRSGSLPPAATGHSLVPTRSSHRVSPMPGSLTPRPVNKRGSRAS